MKNVPRLLLQHATLPAGQVVLGTSFVAGNAALAACAANVPLTAPRLITVAVVVWLVFSRIRLQWLMRKGEGQPVFLRQGRMLIFGTAAVEALLASQLGTAALLAWMAVLGFTLVSARDFYLRRWLAPRRELMVLLRSVRAIVVGAFVAAGSTGESFFALGEIAAGLAVANWSLYGSFVFARRTFGREEEVPNSLSSRLTPAGAALACTALVAAANSLLLLAPLSSSSVIVGASAVAAVVALFYATEPRLDRAVIFRGTMTVFFVGFYASLASTSLLR